MNSQKNKLKHEEFHKATNVQNRIISDDNFTYRLVLEELKRYIKPNRTILDIGCGAGTLCFYLAKRGAKVAGIDISEKAISSCKQSANKLLLRRQTSFEVMNFPYETPRRKFDYVLLIEVIEHLRDDDLTLKKVFLLLKDGGIAIITTPSKNAPLYKLGLANKFDKRVGHLRRYDTKELVKKCEKNGFQVIDLKKKEGLIRNFLFINPIAGKFIRVINKLNLSNFVTIVDNFSKRLFGESDIFIIARKK